MPQAISLVYRNGPTKIDTLELDVSLSETHSGENEITDHPVEEGFNITDHVRAKPDKLTMIGIISNTPLNRTQQKRTIEMQGTKFETSSAEDQIQGVAGYAETALSILRELRASGKLVVVQTQIKRYANMAIESLTIPRDSKTGDAVTFTVVFKFIRVVRNKTTRKVQAKEPKAQPKAKTGKQTTPDATEAQRKKSIAYSTAEKLGLLEKMGIVKK